MATTKLIIRKNKINTAGECVVFVLYTHDGKTTQFSTEKKIAPAFWNEKKGEAKDVEGFKGAKKFNSAIKAKKALIDDIVSESQYRHIEPTLEYVREQYKLLSPAVQPEVKVDLFAIYGQFVEQHNGVLAKGTVKHYKSSLNHLQRFASTLKTRVDFSSIDNKFYDKYIRYLYDLPMSNNTVGAEVKNLKTFLVWASRQGYPVPVDFKDFKKPKAETEIIYLTRKELDTLFSFDLSGNKRLEKVRDLFIFECVTGLRYSDASNVKPENIKGTEESGFYLDLTTVKTRNKLSIPLNPYAMHIIRRNGGSLPAASSNQKMNDYLKELGQLCGIDTPEQRVRYIGSKRIETTVPKYELMTTHAGRRTFITQSLERGLRPEVIMKITGHKDLKTMMRYVKLTTDVVKNEMLRAWNDAPSVFKVS